MMTLSECAPIETMSAREEYVSLAEVQRITGRTVNAIKSMALAGTIRHRSIAGCRTTYARSDAVRVAS